MAESGQSDAAPARRSPLWKLLMRPAAIWRLLRSERPMYRSAVDWMVLSFYSRALSHWRGCPLPWRRKRRQVSVNGQAHPFVLRVGTTDPLVLREILLLRIYEPLFERPLGTVRSVIDLGSNIGLSLRLWLERFPEARVLAVEPDDENLELCQSNVEMAGSAERVKLFHACAAARPREVYLDRGDTEWRYAMRADAAPGARRIGTVTMDQLLAELPPDAAVDLLKCDIEGAERELFADCSGWIRRVRSIAIEVHAPYTPEQFLEDVRRGGGHFAHRVIGRQDPYQLFLWSEQPIQP